MARETTLGASGTSADSYVLAMLSNNLLGTRFKVVIGYAGATEVDLAVEKGEVEGEAGKDWTTLTSTRPQWIRDKRINILVQMGMKPHPDIKDVPMAIDLAQDAGGPPGDGGRVRQIRHVAPVHGAARAAAGAARDVALAFDATLKDPEFLTEAQKLGMEINPVSGTDVEALVTRIMNTPPALAARAREALKPH